MSWDAYEKIREIAIESEIASSWYECVHSGRTRLVDVPRDYRAAVYARITHANATALSPPR